MTTADGQAKRPPRLSTLARWRRRPVPVTERVSANVPFDEKRLRADIASVWGEHGAHTEVFDHMLNLARKSSNTQGVLDAYQAHHESFHPTCNISGPPAPPRPKGHRPYA